MHRVRCVHICVEDTKGNDTRYKKNVNNVALDYIIYKGVLISRQQMTKDGATTKLHIN